MKLRPYLIGGAAGAVLALLFAWWAWHPVQVREGPAAEQPLPSGGVIVRRDPAAPVPAPVKRMAKEAGGKLERSISVTVQPKPATVSARVPPVAAQPDPANAMASAAVGGSPEAQCSCAPVRIDLGLVRMPDHTRRVVATAEGGDLLSSIDIPGDTLAPPRALPWAAGVSYAPQYREFGAFIDRDLGPVRLGVEVQQRREGLTAVVRAGIRF